MRIAWWVFAAIVAAALMVNLALVSARVSQNAEEVVAYPQLTAKVEQAIAAANADPNNLDKLASRGELLLVWGRQDPHTPFEGRLAVMRALNDPGVRYTWHEFNAEHAFLRDEGPRYDPAAADLCFRLAVDLFHRAL